MVELLISRGAEINKGDRDGVTPLALAVSTDKRSLIKVLRSAGGSTTASSVTADDVKHDPMFSHPPPWAKVEKIYAVITNKGDNRTDSSSFNVKKFDFKIFESKEEKKPQQTVAPQQQTTESKSSEFTSFFSTKTSNQEKNVNEPITVKEKNDVKDSVKYSSNTVNVASEPFKNETVDKIENIYDVPSALACDTIEVLNNDDDDVVAAREEEHVKTENKFLQKLKSTSRNLQRNTKDKSGKLKNTIGTFMTVSKAKLVQRRKTNESCKTENISLYSRFVKRVQSSSVKVPKLDKSINTIRGKLSKNSSNQENKVEKKVKEPKVITVTKSNNTETYKAAPVDDKIDIKEMKTRFMKYFKNEKTDKATKPRDNKFKDLKTKVSDIKLGNLKTKMSSFRGKPKSDENNKTPNDTKTIRFHFLKANKKSDNIDNNSRKFFGKFNIGEKWSAVRKPKECSTADTKSKSFKSKTNAASVSQDEKRTRFADENGGFDFKSRASNYNPQPKPFDSKYNAHQYKWNFVNGQWRKSGSAVGLRLRVQQQSLSLTAMRPIINCHENRLKVTFM